MTFLTQRPQEHRPAHRAIIERVYRWSQVGPAAEPTHMQTPAHLSPRQREGPLGPRVITVSCPASTLTKEKVETGLQN